MVLEHQVRNKPLKLLRGLLVTALIVAVLFLDSMLMQLLAPIIGAVALILFWLIGGGVALWTMHRYIMSYSYMLSETVLHMTYRYGRYERMLADIYLNNLVAVGSPEALQNRYGKVRVHRAVRSGCNIEHFAIAYKTDGKIEIYILQPSDEMRKYLEERFPAKKK